jgi:hypothetical protein
VVLEGASDSRGRLENNRFEHLRTGLWARDWFDSAPCTLAQGQEATCMWRRVSAPTVLMNQFTRTTYAMVNGPNLGFAWNEASGRIEQNNFEASRLWAYVEVLPTKWTPTLPANFWGSPTGPYLGTDGMPVPGGRIQARCAMSDVSPLGLPPKCVTPWLPAANPAAGPLLVWG